MTWLLVVILILLLIILAVSVMHRRHLQAIERRLDRVPVNNEETLKDVIRHENAATRLAVHEANSATRLHVSHAVDGIKHNSEATKLDVRELNTQVVRLRDRVQHLAEMIEALAKRVLSIPGQIAQWFTKDGS